MPARLRVTLRKSPISYTAKTRGTVRALGLRRIGQTVEVADNPQTRGMARAVRFLVEVEEAQGGSDRPAARETNRAPRREAAPAARGARGEEGG
jgi:large subunit ribosomal protein L30